MRFSIQIHHESIYRANLFDRQVELITFYRVMPHGHRKFQIYKHTFCSLSLPYMDILNWNSDINMSWFKIHRSSSKLDKVKEFFAKGLIKFQTMHMSFHSLSQSFIDILNWNLGCILKISRSSYWVLWGSGQMFGRVMPLALRKF